MTYRLGARSCAELEGVHPDLVKVVECAIKISNQDFSVHDGMRSRAEQKRYFARGVSKTLKSKHLKQPDGYGHAVDLVPYINGKLRWEWGPIYEITCAVHRAANELGVQLRWGGVWDRVFNDLSAGSATAAKRAVDAYVVRRRKVGRRVFIDGPHFELHRSHFKG